MTNNVAKVLEEVRMVRVSNFQLGFEFGETSGATADPRADSVTADATLDDLLC